MLSLSAFSVFKFISVVIILVAMVMILLGIGHLTHKEESPTGSMTQDFRREIIEEEKVLGDKNVFSKFLARTGSLGVRGLGFISRREGQSNRE